MASLADEIERYIKRILEQRHDATLELQRNMLANQFGCAPSQINYVLSTRFTVEQGYLVESRRGGGGYVRIVKLPMNKNTDFYRFINENIGKMVSQKTGEGLIMRLVEEGILTRREGLLMRAIVDREVLSLDLPQRDMVRANILRAMLLTLLREEFQA